MPETIIKIENLWKEYRYGIVSHNYLFKDLQSWWAKVEDESPNAKIGSAQKKEEGKKSGISNLQLADRFWALRDINLEIKQGEVVGIIGHNGAGKSTLLKILSRVTAPTKGVMKVKGRIGSLLEVGTGFHPELTGRENIFLNGAILGMRKAEIKKKFDEIVAFAEVEKFIDTPVKRYSSGMYVRLAFAVAAHLDPEILVIDEVLAVGDVGFQKKCLGKMGEVSKQEGRTVLFVSHNMSAVQRLCGTSILMENGAIKGLGVSEAIIKQYLKTNAAGIGYTKWNDDNLSPGDGECIKYSSICLKDHKGESTALLVAEESFSIWIEYVIEKPLRNAWLGLELGTTGGETILCCGDTDYTEALHIATQDPGHYRSIFAFPPNLLNEGTYTVGLLGHIPGVKVLVSQKDVLSIDVKVRDQMAGVGVQPGFIRPIIPCATEILKDFLL